MTIEEMKTFLIDEYTDFQEVKQANDGHENKELDYKIKKIAAKLASLGVSVEDLTL